MCEPAAARLQTVTEGDAAKETAASHRLEQPSTVFRSRIPLQSPTPGHHALEAITAKLSNSEMEETILTTVTKLREEGPPLMKLGYITTLRACVDEIERRLVASADD